MVLNLIIPAAAVGLSAVVPCGSLMLSVACTSIVEPIVATAFAPKVATPVFLMFSIKTPLDPPLILSWVLVINKYGVVDGPKNLKNWCLCLIFL